MGAYNKRPLTNMGLGDKAAAFACIEKAIAANAIEKDAVAGTIPIEILVRVAARMGEADRAIATLQKLLSSSGMINLIYVPHAKPALTFGSDV